jgi:chromosome segregation protein
LESDLELSAERLERQSERKQRASEERTEVETRAERANLELEAAEHERRAAAEARQSVQGELDLRTANEEEVKASLTRQREVMRGLEDGLQNEAEALRALAAEQTTLNHDLEELRTQDSVAEAQKLEMERDFATATEEHGRLAETAKGRKRDEEAASLHLERARETLAQARERELQLRADVRQLEDQVALDSARRKALEELERKREGLAPGARALLDERTRFGDDAILGPLSDYLQPTADQAQAAEHLLGDWLHAVLVRDRATVSAIKRWHGETNPGPLLLLPLDPGPSTRGHGSMAISVNPPADGWVRALLADAELDREGGVSVTRSNGAVFLPAIDASGVLSRRAELQTLTTSLTEGKERLDQLARESGQAAHAHEEAEQSLETATDSAARTKAALRETLGQTDEAHRRLMRAEREQNEAAAALDRLRERLTERQARVQHISEELTNHEAERVRLSERHAAERAALAEAEAAQESARERRVHWQVEEAQVSAREEAAGERERRAQDELEVAQRARTALSDELDSLDDNSTQLRDQRAEWEDKLAEGRVTVQETASALEEAETSVRIADDRLVNEERLLEELRAEVDRLGEELHRIEIELTEAAGRRQGLIELVEAEWHKPIEDLLASSDPLEGDEGAFRAREHELVEKLEAMGPVNPLAVQEHAEETARFEFLTEQRDDLVAARATLMQALKEIDETARVMFVETFSAIRGHFHNVFNTLFEGGECDVRLANENDPLTSDIDIQAAPRGKRTQRIHLLSSGERALVAISLLFAIYLTKPAPFCLLDEVDAPLDDANVMRFVRLLDQFKSDTQFIVITHNPRTMQVADAVYGVTMQEPGVSTIVGVRLGEVASVGV